MIIIDTNVATELMKPSPAPAVRNWISARRSDELYTTSITLAEIRCGIERLPAGRRRDLLKATADDVFAAFEDQILPFDAAAAAQYPMIVTRRDCAGLPLDGFDAQIASICHTHDAALATRNLKDFQDTGIDVIDPWQTA
ncbi:MAG TPA: type II toxin-antitoxin system VapC family toxin [Pseudonocardiaceae bacterium]|nr:type II toxin-antitoxin system VapC family toxin [Pseudonocardiaceae bacterium]